jgi:hypothetical protein
MLRRFEICSNRADGNRGGGQKADKMGGIGCRTRINTGFLIFDKKVCKTSPELG